MKNLQIVYIVSYSPDSTRIATGHMIRDAKTGVLIVELLEGHLEIISSISFSPDCNPIATGS